jgi:hypothetical protein
MSETSSKVRWTTYRRRVNSYLKDVDFDGLDNASDDEYMGDEFKTATDTSFKTLHSNVVASLSTDVDMDIEEPVLMSTTPSTTSQTVMADNLSSDDLQWKFIDSDNRDDSDSDYDDDELTGETKSANLSCDIGKWACSFNITHAALNGLLKCLKENGLDVPTCAKTLLKTR